MIWECFRYTFSTVKCCVLKMYVLYIEVYSIHTRHKGALSVMFPKVTMNYIILSIKHSGPTKKGTPNYF